VYVTHRLSPRLPVLPLRLHAPQLLAELFDVRPASAHAPPRHPPAPTHGIQQATGVRVLARGTVPQHQLRGRRAERHAVAVQVDAVDGGAGATVRGGRQLVHAAPRAYVPHTHGAVAAARRHLHTRAAAAAACRHLGRLQVSRGAQFSVSTLSLSPRPRSSPNHHRRHVPQCTCPSAWPSTDRRATSRLCAGDPCGCERHMDQQPRSHRFQTGGRRPLFYSLPNCRRHDGSPAFSCVLAAPARRGKRTHPHAAVDVHCVRRPRRARRVQPQVPQAQPLAIARE
jgi:hypothetical protein